MREWKLSGWIQETPEEMAVPNETLWIPEELL